MANKFDLFKPFYKQNPDQISPQFQPQWQEQCKPKHQKNWLQKALWEATCQPQAWYRSSSSIKSSFCITFGSKPTAQMVPRSLKHLIQKGAFQF